MSTTINVTVDDGGLPAKNRQQTAANRQAFVQGQASQQAAQQGADQRAADRRAAGLDPATGRPLASAGASSRLPRIQQEPAANRRGEEFFLLRPDAPPSNGVLQLTHRGLISLAYTSGGGVLTYSGSLGPNGSPTLICAPIPDLRLNFVGIIGPFPFEGSTSRFKDGVQDFTLQYYAKFGADYAAGQDDIDISVRVGTNGVIDISLNLDTRGSGANTAAYRSLLYRVVGDSTKPLVDLYDATALLSSTTGPQMLPGVWHHVAISRQGRAIRAFFDGEMIGSADVDWSTLLFDPDFTSSWLSINFGASQERSGQSQPVYLHGLRFDTKALYTANFIPPLSL